MCLAIPMQLIERDDLDGTAELRGVRRRIVRVENAGLRGESLRAQLPRIPELLGAGHPEEVNFRPQFTHQPVTFARRPALNFKIDQLPVDPPVYLQNGNSFGLGRMRRNGWAYIKSFQGGGNRPWINSRGRIFPSI